MKFLKLYLIILIIGISIISFTYQNSYAITITTQSSNGVYISKSQLIGIQLSPTCLTLIKNHMKTNCPTYDKLQSLDNTNPLWAGEWFNDTYYHRHIPRVSNHYLMNPNPFVVMVDPDSSYTTLAKMIIIQPDNFTYINPNESVGMNHTRNEYNNRFVSNCTDVTVAPIISLINDTIKYLESGCTITNYNEKVSIKTGNKPFYFNNPYSSILHDTYLMQIFHNHKFFNHPNGTSTGGLGPDNCINIKCNFKDPYKNPKW